MRARLRAVLHAGCRVKAKQECHHVGVSRQGAKMRRIVGLGVLVAVFGLSGCSSNPAPVEEEQSAEVSTAQQDHGLRVPQSGDEDLDLYLPEPGEMPLSNEEAWSLYLNIACGVEWKADAEDEAFQSGDLDQIRAAAAAHLEATLWADTVLDSSFYGWPAESGPALAKMREVLSLQQATSEAVIAASDLDGAARARGSHEPMPTLQMQRALELTDLGAPSCTGYGDTLEALAIQIAELDAGE